MRRIDVEAVECVVAELQRLGVRYCIGGSAASSFHGVPRSTADVDLVAELLPEHIGPLVDRLSLSCYVSAEAARSAVSRRSSFNVIHLATSYKIDVFVPSRSGSSQIDRAREAHVFGRDEHSFYVASAEDTIVSKLRWYREGGESSSRQWADVVGVLRMSRDALDGELLSREAMSHGVDDLLDRARRDAAVPG